MTDRIENDTKSSWVDVLDTLREQDVRIAHVGLFDLMGVFRERRLGIEDAAQVFDGGGTFVNVLQQWDAGESVFGKGPFVGEPVSIDPSSARHYPFEDHACFLIADFDGPSAELSPRKLLQKQINKAATQGIGVRAAFEFEFFILNETAASLRQTGFSSLSTFAEDNRCWSGSSAATHASLISSLSDVLASGGVDMLSLGMELGPGCFEATLRHKDAMVAADNAAVFKLFTRAFCRRQDLTASFMAQVDSGFSGLSGHIHLSLYDLETGLDLFPDAADGRGMSDLFKYFIGGMLEMAPHSMPLTHHTVNAYRRHSPGNWAPRSVSWAVQNYSAAVRVVPYPPGACRLEYRLPGSDINPYLALAFVLGAGLWGTENEMTLPEEFLGGGPDEMPQDGARLPHDLFEAIENMARSSHAAEIWGDRFVSHFIEACRAEESALRRETSSAERARYLEIV